jgi:hypothetical protein
MLGTNEKLDGIIVTIEKLDEGRGPAVRGPPKTRYEVCVKVRTKF